MRRFRNRNGDEDVDRPVALLVHAGLWRLLEDRSRLRARLLRHDFSDRPLPLAERSLNVVYVMLREVRHLASAGSLRVRRHLDVIAEPGPGGDRDRDCGAALGRTARLERLPQDGALLRTVGLAGDFAERETVFLQHVADDLEIVPRQIRHLTHADRGNLEGPGAAAHGAKVFPGLLEALPPNRRWQARASTAWRIEGELEQFWYSWPRLPSKPGHFISAGNLSCTYARGGQGVQGAGLGTQTRDSDGTRFKTVTPKPAKLRTV